MPAGIHNSPRGPKPKGKQARTEELKLKMEPGHRALLHKAIEDAGWLSTTDYAHAVARGEVEVARCPEGLKNEIQ